MLVLECHPPISSLLWFRGPDEQNMRASSFTAMFRLDDDLYFVRILLRSLIQK